MPLIINCTKGRVINTSLLSPVCKALSTFQVSKPSTFRL